MQIFGQGKARIYKSRIISSLTRSSRNSSDRHILRYISPTFKGWKPALLGVFGFFIVFANRVRQDVVKLKLPELIQSEGNLELFKYCSVLLPGERKNCKDKIILSLTKIMSIAKKSFSKGPKLFTFNGAGTVVQDNFSFITEKNTLSRYMWYNINISIEGICRVSTT